MLLCSLSDIPVGSIIAAPVCHPQRLETELLATGAPLDERIIKRLKDLGIERVWINHSATDDLNHVMPPNLARIRREAYEQIKSDFAVLQTQTASTATIQNYRRLVLELVCELIGNHHVASLTEQLMGGPTTLFTHCSNVAYLSIVIGLELESYVVNQRPQSSSDAARDMTGLGIGAMLHDIGKTGIPDEVARKHVTHPTLKHVNQLSPQDAEPDDPFVAYHDHPYRGYMMLRNCRAPATSTQVVLTHHQRWDGSGWPDMSRVTDRRRFGPQEGKGIHIFSRIVAIADALDSLMDEDDRRQPPAKALKALGSKRFNDWFDPIVRDRALRVFPPFAIGSQITLSDGRQAVVVAPNLDQPCRPTVRVLSESARLPDGRYPLLNLNAIDSDLRVIRCAGTNVEPYLFKLNQSICWQHQTYTHSSS